MVGQKISDLTQKLGPIYIISSSDLLMNYCGSTE